MRYTSFFADPGSDSAWGGVYVSLSRAGANASRERTAACRSTHTASASRLTVFGIHSAAGINVDPSALVTQA